MLDLIVYPAKLDPAECSKHAYKRGLEAAERAGVKWIDAAMVIQFPRQRLRFQKYAGFNFLTINEIPQNTRTATHIY